MLKKIIFTAVLLISTSLLFAQNKGGLTNARPLHNFSLNLGGDGSLISINFERLSFINPRFFIAGQLGIGYNEEFLLFGGDPERYGVIPHQFTGNWGKGKHFFEFGLSGAIVTGNTNKHYLLGPIIGYRIQPLKSNKVNFRVFASIPLIGFDTDLMYIPWGLSIGICF